MTQQIVYIDPNELQPNPLQPRGVIAPDSIMDLVDSVREHGILEPLVVAHTPAGYQIIAGERRWRASKLANLQTVPVIIKETSPQGMLEMALVENVQREDLNSLERAKAFERLAQEFSLSNAEIAKRIGKSPSYVVNSLKLLQLPDALKDGLLSGLITEGHARALQGIKDPVLMVDAYKTILMESGSVRKAEDLARRMRKKLEVNTTEIKKMKPMERVVDEDVDAMEVDMAEVIGKSSKVTITRTQRRTRIIINIPGSTADTEIILRKIYKTILGVGTITIE